MVTANRRSLARRSLECLARQHWNALELIIVDDGDEDYSSLLSAFHNRMEIRYERIARNEDLLLGELRNLALDLAGGEYCIQWDDDEWYHPDRIRGLWTRLNQTGKAAMVTRFALMHLQEPTYRDHPFRIDGIDGIPGSILHRRTEHRYPNIGRSEDLAFMEAFQKEGQLGVTPEGSHWMIRCYHGGNTWARSHFLGKLGRTWKGKGELLLARYLRRDLFSHSAFSLTAEEASAFAQMMEMNKRLGLP